MTTTHTVLRHDDVPNENVEATDFAIKDHDLYLYDDTRPDGEQTVAVFPGAHWTGILVDE